MKKVIFALAAVVALAACSQEEVIVADKGAAIGFDTFVENSTRAAVDPSFVMGGSNMFTEFGVFGAVENSPLFSNEKVYKSGDNWIYDHPQYWIVGAKYNFAAVAPYNAYTNAQYASANYEGTTILSFVNGYADDAKIATNGTTDLLYATTVDPIQGLAASGTTTPANGKVQFNFRHVLSKVKFSFENAYNASMATIKVYDVKINNAYASADATFTTNATEWANKQGTIVLDFGNASDNEATTDKENAEVAYGYGKTYESLNERLLIPGVATPLTDDANAGYKVTFKVDLLVNGTKIKTYDHVAYANFTPVAGHAYDIKTAINASNIDPQHKQEPIEFTVTTIGEWGTDDNGDAEGNNNKVM